MAAQMACSRWGIGSVELPGIAIEKPLVLAPMDEITDRPFRRLARRFGADLVYTEFISAEGLLHDAGKSLRKLQLAPDEHPVAVQVFGSRIPSVVEAVERAAAAGADWVDLNFGCPVRKVAGKGGGAGLLREPEKLEEMTRAAVKAVSVPVTAKVRLGWDVRSINVLDICRRIEQAGAAVVAVHARTRGQGYAVLPDWSWIARVKESVSIPVIGNGNVREPEDAARMFRETGCDGVMIGRAALGNPWIFSRTREYLRSGRAAGPPSLDERITVLLQHLNEAADEKGERRAVIEMRKMYSGYLKGLPGAARLRAALMEPVDIASVAAILRAYRR
jgi:tRNA-dihydrouridine synthase B